MRNDRDFLVINNRNLMDFGVYLFGEIPHVMPTRDIEEVVIPGRNGSLTIDNGRWNNVKITYQMVMLGDGDKRIDDLMGFLISLIGNVKIEDSREPDYYRMGRLVELPDWRAAREAGTLKLSFDCRPEKWLVDNPFIDLRGTEALSHTTTLINPTEYDAHPLLLVNNPSGQQRAVAIINRIDEEDGNYYATPSAYYIYISADASFDVWIDCETGDAWHYGNTISPDEIVNCNQYITITHVSAYSMRVSEFPIIAGAKNWIWNYDPQRPPVRADSKHVNTKAYTMIMAPNAFETAKMYPRWWTL